MKSQRILIWAGCLALVGSLSVWAGEKNESAKQPPAQTEKQSDRQSEKTQVAQPADKAPLKNQTNCPVMGGVIDSSAYTDIQGQRVYHCCPMCTKKLVTDPEHYFQQAAKAGILFENVQKKCPVSEMKLVDTIYTDYVGRRIYFGSEECRETFLKEPTKYLSNLMDELKADGKPMNMDKMTGSKSDHVEHGKMDTENKKDN